MFCKLIMKKLLCLLFLLCTCAIFDANARDDVYVCLESKIKPKIDGVLDDKAWKNVKKDKISLNLADLSKTEKDSEFYVLYNNDTLYLGIICKDPDMENLVALDEHKDGRWEDDCIEIFLGSPKNKNLYYSILLNPDGKDLTQKKFEGNASWNPKIKIATKKKGNYWSAEIAIPFSELPFKKNDKSLAFNICRSFYVDDYVRKKSTWAKLKPLATSMIHNNPNEYYFFHQPEYFGCLKIK